MPMFIPELGVSQSYQHDPNQGEYYQYVHWRFAHLSTIHDNGGRNADPQDDGCPLKKYKPTQTDYKDFDEFVCKGSAPFYVKPPEPDDKKDVIYLGQVKKKSKGSLPPPGGVSPVKVKKLFYRVVSNHLVGN